LWKIVLCGFVAAYPPVYSPGVLKFREGSLDGTITDSALFGDEVYRWITAVVDGIPAVREVGEN
jgi:hypothetical protein